MNLKSERACSTYYFCSSNKALILQVFLSTRRGAWIFNRVGDNGQPGDLIYSNRATRYVVPICLPLHIQKLLRLQYFFIVFFFYGYYFIFCFILWYQLIDHKFKRKMCLIIQLCLSIHKMQISNYKYFVIITQKSTMKKELNMKTSFPSF